MRSRRVLTFGLFLSHGLFTVGVATPTSSARAQTDTAAAPTADAVPVIKAVEALEHEGQERCVEMVVKAARKLPDKEICFLNSEEDHRAADNFTAVILKAGLQRFHEEGIANPALHFIDATIRVRGVIENREGRAQIVIEQPGQVTIVKVAKPDPAGTP